MPDFGDLAQESTELFLRQCFRVLEASRSKYTACNLTSIFCESCGSRIPEKRRKAVPGCRFCIDCQADQEI